MTGIERLRELAEGTIERSVWACADDNYCEAHGLNCVDNDGPLGKRLADIADQIEREQNESTGSAAPYDYRVVKLKWAITSVLRDMERRVLGHEGMEDSPVARWARELREALGALHAPGFQKSRKVANSLTSHSDASDVSMSAYDLLPQEERDAIAWVREHGGLDQVKIDYDVYEDFSDLVDRIAARLGVSVAGLDAQDAEPIVTSTLDRRLMPEGMEWPRYDTGELVDFGDEVDRGDGVGASVDKAVFYGDQWRLYDRYGCEINEDMMGPGERVKRPAPKVLDADGAEIRVGDTVWGLQSAKAYAVDGFVIDGSHGEYTVDAHYVDGLEQAYLMPNQLTHRAPVLAADGRPLREGETAWYVPTPDEAKECKVEELPKREKGERAVCLRALDGTIISCPTRYVTHERPDSWERLEDDAEDIRRDIAVYLGDYSQSDFKETGDSIQDRVRGLVRRAKRLAERGQ